LTGLGAWAAYRPRFEDLRLLRAAASRLLERFRNLREPLPTNLGAEGKEKL
jgi:hypothetical protein